MGLKFSGIGWLVRYDVHIEEAGLQQQRPEA
jgi:hypothetical protein